MEDRYLKVDGYESLIKDDQTSSFINTDQSSLIRARMAKSRILTQQKEKEDLELKVIELEKKLNAILEALGE